MKQLADCISNFCRDFEDFNRKKPLLLLSGIIGTGKTRIARQLYRRASGIGVDCWFHGNWPHPPQVCFVRWAEFIESESDGVEQDAREADLTILDDIGSETDRYKSGAPMDKLCQLLGAREGKFTLLTSNIHLEEWATRDARLADRLLRRGQRFEIRNTLSFQQRA